MTAAVVDSAYQLASKLGKAPTISQVSGFFNYLTLVMLNILRCHTTSNFQPSRLHDPSCSYKFSYLMTNSADPDQLASSQCRSRSVGF